MKREFVEIQGKQFPRIADVTLIGDWEELQGVTASTINPALGSENLNGLLIKGYEMKWNAVNENGEKYEPTAFDNFIEDYFVAKNLNMPVDINHEGFCNYKAICGRVLYIERNSVGFYFAIYVPRSFEDYDALKWRLEQGIIQGFSKEGYATEWEYNFKQDGTFDFELVKEMKLLSVSLVSTPANGVKFEKMQEVKNSLVYITKDIEIQQDNAKSALEAMFNN